MQQAKQKQLEAVEQNIRETEAKIKEIVTQFNSDLLSENPQVAFQVTGSKTKYALLAFRLLAHLILCFLLVRVLADRYKGMSSEQIAAVRAEQATQVLDFTPWTHTNLQPLL